jgi:acyl-CoA synthetase (AMP-forming)/AMP-acid ligase II
MADCFLSEGHTVYPGDLERVPSGHPSVADAGVGDVRRPSGS